jgi:hypothetical protein
MSAEKMCSLQAASKGNHLEMSKSPVPAAGHVTAENRSLQASIELSRASCFIRNILLSNEHCNAILSHETK